MALYQILGFTFFLPKCTKQRLAAGLCPEPLDELTALPRPPSWIKGSLLLKEGNGKGVEGGEKRGGEVRVRKEGKGR